MKRYNHKSVIAIVALTASTAFIPSFADDNDYDVLPMAPDEMSLTDTLSEKDANPFDNKFLEAIIQVNTSNNDSAKNLLNQCLVMNPNAAEAHYEIATIYQQQSNDTLTLLHLKQAATLQPKNDFYQESLARYYLNSGNYDEAIIVYEDVLKSNQNRTDVLDILLQLYEQKKDYRNMLTTINKIEQVEGSSEEITLSKMRVYDLLGDNKSSFKSLKALSLAHPNDVNYKVMCGNWLMQHKKEKDAFKIFDAAIKEEPENVYAMSSLYDYYNAIGNKDKANDIRENILINSGTPSKTKINFMQQVIKDNEYYHQGDSTVIINIFNKIIKSNPKDADMMQLEAAYMQLKKMSEDSINNIFTHVLEIAPDAASARIQILQSLWPKQKWDDIINISKPGLLYNPEEMAFYYFLGMAYYQKKDENKALYTFQRGVGEINSESNPDIVSDFYALMGDILHGKGLSKEAFAAYDSCLQWKDDNMGCLNNYAYYLSEKDSALDKAEVMSFKTIKEEPKNTTYLDTYAWILFKEGRYADAKIYTDQAIKCDTDTITGPSAVIWEHAGDIYAMNGDTKNAIKYWQHAIELGGDKAIIGKKIKLKKYIK